ncbi:hypothetical protein [Amycolatopsis coloradensis]|nr:hypothetical protein [Amycolatopsis coloradensis]
MSISTTAPSTTALAGSAWARSGTVAAEDLLTSSPQRVTDP